MNVDLPVPAVALAIVAHPDDAEFQCGATLAKWSAAGTEVHHLVCTDGSKGTWDPDCDQEALVELRRREQEAAARRLGATGQVHFLGRVDGELDSGLTTRSEVALVIRRVKPTVVLGHDPWKQYRLHPDHRHAGILAVEGVVAARDPFFFPEHGVPHHRPDALLLFEVQDPDHAEDTRGWEGAKVAALLEHVSQFVTTHDIVDPDDAAQVARFARWVEAALVAGGEQAGLESAELYKLIGDL
jgi:LmbE family N-acetylglucosaminyl deacetylase